MEDEEGLRPNYMKSWPNDLTEGNNGVLQVYYESNKHETKVRLEDRNDNE